MKVTDVITLGDKIDIRLSRQLRKQENGGEEAAVYQSSVSDYLSDKELEISMPTQGGRMVLFQMGAECSLIFYTKGGMYTTTATVTKRFRRDGLYLLTVLLTGSLVKFQRREFFRVDHSSQVEYYKITMEIAKSRTMQEIFTAIEEEPEAFSKQTGNMQDVSGGGIRFSAAEGLEPNTYVLVKFRLSNGKMDESFRLVGQVVGSYPHERASGLFNNRIEFLFKDLRDREKIVRFVFEEERRIRKKEVGD
jgi:c-di-GMP-binding flagellar brake protein YcgR